MRWLAVLAVFGCRGVWYPGPPDQTDTVRLLRVFVDPDRATPEILDLPGAEKRVLETSIWIGPATGTEAPERPLLLVAHGFDGHPDKLDAFARALAEAGVVVAAPRFPVTHDGSGAGALGAADLVEQPADLDRVLEGLIAARDDPDDPELFERFHPDRVVALGHSLGGATVLGWTRFGSTPPIAGTVYLAPAEPLTTVFGPEPDVAGPPTLLAHGTDDQLVSYPVSEGMYARFDDPTWLLGLAGAGHSEALEDPSEPPVPARDALQRATLGFVWTALHGDPGPLNAALAQLGAEGHTIGW